MSSNSGAKRLLEQIYGKGCMFQKARIANKIYKKENKKFRKQSNISSSTTPFRRWKNYNTKWSRNK